MPAIARTQRESRCILLIEIRKHLIRIAVDPDGFESKQARSALDAIEPRNQARVDLVQLAVNRPPFRCGMNQARIRAEIEQVVVRASPRKRWPASTRWRTPPRIRVP